MPTILKSVVVFLGSRTLLGCICRQVQSDSQQPHILLSEKQHLNMASRARVWCYQLSDYVIAFNAKFNQAILSAMKSDDPLVRREGFDLFRRGLQRMYKPSDSATAATAKKTDPKAETCYVCIFNPLSILSHQKFEGYLALGTRHITDTISPTLLEEFARLIPQTRAAIEEKYDERFESIEEVVNSLLRTVLHLYDPLGWPIPHSLPPICVFGYNKSTGFSTRTGLKPTVDRWSDSVQRFNTNVPRTAAAASEKETMSHHDPTTIDHGDSNADMCFKDLGCDLVVQ